MTQTELTGFALWGGWVVSGILGITGLITTSFGWYVRGKQAKTLAIKKDTHDAIDKAIKCLSDFEDTSVSFWCKSDSDVYHFHILSAHKRLVIAYKQLCEFKSQAMPNHILAELRKVVTLDYESLERPISSNDPKMLKLLNITSRALDSELLLKTWTKDEEPGLLTRIKSRFS